MIVRQGDGYNIPGTYFQVTILYLLNNLNRCFFSKSDWLNISQSLNNLALNFPVTTALGLEEGELGIKVIRVSFEH